jgi:alkylation response protein AidB-like acyl-CoA dehydrogenase
VDFSYPADTEQFRKELRAWLAANLTDEVRAAGRHRGRDPEAFERLREWDATLADAGWAAVSWPQEYGGRGATVLGQLAYAEETTRARAPLPLNVIGMNNIAPAIMQYGTAEQQRGLLPRMVRADDIWCQGMSEPEAGSDLASLRTRAVRDGDDFVVNGQKIWTSLGHHADWCQLYVRTDPDAPKHKGITWMVMPMDSPGIEIRPMKTLTGVSEFSEMFLDEVHIPVENRVGDENDGWRVAMVTFSFERGTAFVSELLGSFRLVADLAEVARTTGAWADDHVRRELAIIAAELEAQWAMTKRNVSRAARFGTAGVGGSVFKLAYHDTKVRMGDLAMEVLGRAGLAMGDPTGIQGADHVERRLYTLSLSIAAGTAQIQRNIVGERMLGLPRER